MVYNAVQNVYNAQIGMALDADADAADVRFCVFKQHSKWMYSNKT